MAKATLIRKSDQEVLRESVKYPKKNISIINSLDVDLKWLIDNKEGKPVYNNTTHKLEIHKEITTTEHPIHTDFHQYRIYYLAVELTSQELDDLEEEESEEKRHIENGERLFRNTYLKIWRRRNKPRHGANKLTQAQGRRVMEWFQPCYEFLITGNWYEARKEINRASLSANIAAEENAGTTDTYNSLVADVEDYFQNTYDL